MKKTFLILSLAIVAAGCKKKEERVDNEATRYAESLKQSALKADAVADKADAAVAEQNARMKEAESLGN
jgi:hypothetical protein